MCGRRAGGHSRKQNLFSELNIASSPRARIWREGSFVLPDERAQRKTFGDKSILLFAWLPLTHPKASQSAAASP